MRKETHPQNEMLKGTLDMMILRHLLAVTLTGTPSQRSSSTSPKIFWRWSRAHYIQRSIGSKIVNGFLPTVVRARTIARQSSIG